MVLPTGDVLDLSGHLRLEALLAEPSCREVVYRLDVYASAALQQGGPEADDVVATAEQRGNGARQLTFDVRLDDLAALRDPVDSDGRARCAYVVLTTKARKLRFDRAPDAGRHIACPDGVATQPPFH